MDVSGSFRILAVDDNKQNLSLLEKALRTAQYQVITAEDGETALELIGSAAPDLVLLDVMMPGMSGPQMIETILGRRPDVHVLFLSGYTEEASALTGQRPANVAFLQKPFSFSALLTKTREVLRAQARP